MSLSKKDQLRKKKPLKEKLCAYSGCDNLFTPNSRDHKCCHYTCATAYAKEVKAERKRKDQNKSKAELRNTDKVLISKDVQKIANRIGKLKEMIKGNLDCCTCGGRSPQMDGGHWLPTSTYSPIRYNVCQINPQCKSCNRFNGGMPKEYREYMIEKVGLEKVLWFESHKGTTMRYSLDYLLRYKRVMGKKLKKMEKRYAEM